MTKRLYYADAYLTHFTAHVLERLDYQNHPTVVLDRTAFYPTSGGQPFDRGTLDGTKVIDVVEREADGAVLHLLEAPHQATDPKVTGKIDWARRFDHMQQHTGQHVLSQVFIQIAQAETVSFHLGTESATIDLDGPQRLSQAEMMQAESSANQIVWENRPVTARILSPGQLDEVPLRKPPAVSGDVRVIQVADFDWSACGGTHVAHTGEIGMIKIVRWEKRGDETRVEFVCGQRALQDYRQKNAMILQVAAGFNVGYWELDQAIERLTEEAKTLRSSLRQVKQNLIHYKAAELRAAAKPIGEVRVVVQELTDHSMEDMREMARQLVSGPGVVALLGRGEQKAQLCFARSPDVEANMVTLVRDTAATLGAPQGGGKPDFAQGGGPLTKEHTLNDVLDWATQRLAQLLKS